MKIVFFENLTTKEIKDQNLATWAAHIINYKDGCMAFESFIDFLSWEQEINKKGEL